MEKLIYQIALTQIKGIGSITAKTLLAHVGDIEDIFKQTRAQLLKIPQIGEYLVGQLTKERDEAFRRAEREMEFIVKKKITPLFFTDEKYPYRLKECDDAPIIVYARGNQDFNAGRFVSIVGTRKLTDYGRGLCQELVADLAQKNITIVSGLAYGADICAHKAALDAGLNTVGVLGHGLDRIYPALHRSTAVKMLSQGALLTEYLSETTPDAPNFLQRNRIVAGLADAVVVIESAKKGGSLSTATLANDYNRDVFAFAGRVGDEFSAGCNALIKENKAALIESAEDLEKMMGWEISPKGKNAIEPTLFTDLSEEEKKVLLLTKDGMHINQIALKMELPISRIAPMLIEMEFKGVIKPLPGSMYRAI
ncbi:DNA processing protein DprA [Bacteroidia bacterium]|nr:DNA processing protein DprA [Bacteroidia bacterium]